MHWSELIARNAYHYPREVAIIRGQQRMTFQELNERANRVANGLAKMGITRGDRVALLSHNAIEFIEVLFGIWKTGASVTTINFRSAPAEVEHYLSFSGSKALFFNEAYLSIIDPVLPNLTGAKRFFCFTDREKKTLSSRLPAKIDDYEVFLAGNISDDVACRDLDEQDEAFLFFTSGSTGNPKAIPSTHRMQTANALCFTYELEVRGPDNTDSPEAVLLVTPLFHAGALTHMFSHFFAGARTVIFESPSFDPRVCVEVASREKVTCLVMPNRPWLLVLDVIDSAKYDLSSLRKLVMGSESVPVALIERMWKAFPGAKIMNVYGLTESSGCSVLYLRDKDYRKAPSVGKPFLNVWCRVVDGEGRDVAPGQGGEIILKGDQIVKEYYNNPKATAESFKNGWFYTGDQATIDEEGFITVAGRTKEMYISGGENIYPLEIEEVLFKHPKILEAAVVGVPDEKWGETGVAVIALKPGEQMTAEEVIAYMQSQMARYKVPRRVKFMDAIPRTTSGKVVKAKLREELIK